MAWKVIRKATIQDRINLARRAFEFVYRHKLELYCADSTAQNIATDLDLCLDLPENKRLKRYWKAIVKRTLKCDCDGIINGYVGRYSD